LFCEGRGWDEGGRTSSGRASIGMGGREGGDGQVDGCEGGLVRRKEDDAREMGEIIAEVVPW